MLLLALFMWLPDHSGASGTPAVWTLRDWQESEDVLVKSPFEDPEGNGPVP